MPAAASRVLGALCLLALLTGQVRAADPSLAPREEGRHVFDRAEVLEPTAVGSYELRAARLLRDTGVDVVVLVRVRPETDSFEAARAEAEALVAAWSIGMTEATDALVVLVDLDESRCHGQFQFYADEAVRTRFTDEERQAAFEGAVAPRLAACDLTGAVDAAIEAAEADLLAGAPVYSDRPTAPGTLPPGFSLSPEFVGDPPGFEAEPGPGFGGSGLALIVALCVVVAGILAAVGATKGRGGFRARRTYGSVGHAADPDPLGPVAGSGGSSGSAAPSSDSEGGAGGRF